MSAILLSFFLWAQANSHIEKIQEEFQNYSPIHNCYRVSNSGKKKKKGKVVYDINVNLEGGIMSGIANAKKSSLNDRNLNICVINVMKTLSVPVEALEATGTLSVTLQFPHQ